MLSPQKRAAAALFLVLILSAAGYEYEKWSNQQLDALSSPVSSTATPKSSSNSGWKMYTNQSSGISFEYPPSVIVYTEKLGKDSNTVTVSADGDLMKNYNAPMGYDSESLAKDKAALAAGDAAHRITMAVPDSYHAVTVPGALAKEYTILSQLDVCSIMFEQEIVIYKGSSVYFLAAHGPVTTTIANNPQFFTDKDPDCAPNPKFNEKNFYGALKSGQTDQISQTWFNVLDQILPTVRFTK